MSKDFMCHNCEETFQSIINAMCEGYAVHEIICDDTGRPVNYRFLEINNSFEQITAQKREDIIGKTVRDIYPDIDSFWTDTYGKVALTGEPAQFENYAVVLDKYFRVSVFTPRQGIFITLFTDITEIKRSEEILKKHKILFDCAQDAVLYISDGGKIIDANEAAFNLYAYTCEELLNMSIHDIRHDSTRDKFDQQMKKADEGGIVFESIHVKKGGSAFPVEVSARSTLIGNNKIRIHIIRDITERKSAEEKIMYLARYDSLTGVPNRAFLMSELDKAMEQANRGDYKLALMLFDIDKFKLINDVHGHHAGDIALKTVASRVQDIIRKIDMVGRLGGDEFIIIQPMIKSSNDALTLVNRIFNALGEPISIGSTEMNVNLSIGVSIYPDNAADKESLINCADDAMYKAKKESGNSYSFFR